MLSNGSQTRKTRTKKDLVLVRLLKDGHPTCLMKALADVDEYGDATVNNLKRAVDDAFAGKCVTVYVCTYCLNLFHVASNFVHVAKSMLTAVILFRKCWSTQASLFPERKYYG